MARVLIIGAGGAGLRAAIEASAAGAKTALVCKSLLGKAHTVMAEGGVAAALANLDDRDSWETHFRDTMKGGKYLNQWRMAQLHAQEAPRRVRELEEINRQLRAMLEGREQQEESAQKLTELWGQMVEGSIKTQAAWMEAWADNESSGKTAANSLDEEE